MIPLPKGSLYYFDRVMNWDHTPCADWREVQPKLSLQCVVLLRMIRLVVPRVQRVGGLRGPHLTRHRSASSF